MSIILPFFLEKEKVFGPIRLKGKGNGVRYRKKIFTFIIFDQLLTATSNMNVLKIQTRNK